MTTLKSLVDETTKIKNELRTCHANLKNNLASKNVSISNTDKLSNLIDKITNIDVLNDAMKNQKISYKIAENTLSLSTDFTGLNQTYFKIKDNYLYLVLEDKNASTSYFKTCVLKYNLSTKKIENKFTIDETGSTYQLHTVYFLDATGVTLLQLLIPN